MPLKSQTACCRARAEPMPVCALCYRLQMLQDTIKAVKSRHACLDILLLVQVWNTAFILWRKLPLSITQNQGPNLPWTHLHIWTLTSSSLWCIPLKKESSRGKASQETLATLHNQTWAHLVDPLAVFAARQETWAWSPSAGSHWTHLGFCPPCPVAAAAWGHLADKEHMQTGVDDSATKQK